MRCLLLSLNKYLPLVLYNEKTLNRVYSSQESELNSVNDDIQDLINNCFISTATWGLDTFEKEYRIATIESDTYEIRRSRILAKIRSNGIVTKAMIQSVAESFQNGTVDVIEDNPNDAFTIKFTSLKGIPPKIEDIKNAIGEIKPAHLIVSYLYLLNTHLMLNSYKHYELEHYTHKQLRELELAHTLLNTYADLETYTYNNLAQYTYDQLRKDKIT